LERRAGRLGGLALGLARRVDRRAVLGPDVVALAHALRRVVVLPEELQQRVIAGLPGVVDDEDGLGVAGPRAADLVVRRVRGVAAGVSDGGRVDAGRLPEDALGAPEAAEPEDGLLEALGERRRDRGAEHVVALGDTHGLVATGQRVG